MMPAATQVYWAGVATLFVGIVLFVWALFVDAFLRYRRGKIKRCPKCWYTMEHIANPRCPECGFVVTRPKSLLKSRRRWRSACVGFALAVIGAAGGWYPRLSVATCISFTPSFVLVNLINEIHSPRQTFSVSGRVASNTTVEIIEDELWRRYSEGRLALWERRNITGKQFKNQAPLMLETRARWPQDASMAAIVRNAFRGPLPRTLRATVQIEGGRTVVASDPGWGDRYGESFISNRWLQELGPAPADLRQINLAVSIAESDAVVWSGTISCPVMSGGRIDEVIAPQSSETLDDAVRTAAASGLKVSPQSVWLVFQPLSRAELKDITFALRVSLMHGKETVASGRILWTDYLNPAKTQWGSSGREHPDQELWCRLEGDIARVNAADPNDADWRIDITGDSKYALSDFAASKYWAGSVALAFPNQASDVATQD